MSEHPNSDSSQEPVPVFWPPFRPLFVGLVPYVLLIGLALWPVTRDLINLHPVWAAAIGGLALLMWQGARGGWLAYGLDSWLRTADFVVNRTYGPDTQGHTGLAKIRLLLTRGGLLNGYSLPIALWTLLTLFIAVFGPSRTPLNSIPWVNEASELLRQPTWSEFFRGVWLSLGLVLASCALLFVLWLGAAVLLSWLTEIKRHRLPIITMMVLATTVLGVTGAVIVLRSGTADDVWAEADHTIYHHIFLLFIGLAVLLSLLARWLLCGFERNYSEKWKDPELLRRAELFVQLPRVSDANDVLGFWHNFRSVIDAPIRNPHMLLFPIAVALLLFPSAYMNFVAVAVGLFAWSVLALAGTHPRLHNVLDWLQRLFFHGVLWIVSLFVIFLAACRFADISYVATLTNSASSLTLLWFIASIYILIWYYKYWVGQAIAEELLNLLRTDQKTSGPVDYPIDDAFRDNRKVDAKPRCLQVHGTRFVVIGTFRSSTTRRIGQAWEFYDVMTLFDTLAHKQPVERDPADASAEEGKKASATTNDPEAIDRAYGLSDLRQRVSVYHVVLDVTVLACLGLFFWVRMWPEPKAQLTAEKEPERLFALQDHLFRPRADGDAARGAAAPKAVILFAASGGGTRAALYSAAVLRGLGRQGALDGVRLCSGVSGGSAAIAHFAIHRDDLSKKDSAAAWDRYASALSAPFIDDVLCGTLEWRIARGTRMGVLLDESLHRHIYGREKPLSKSLRMGEVANLGIIFNSTLAGSQKGELAADPTEAGSRLVVTNVQIDDDTFPAANPNFPGVTEEYLHFVVVTDPTVRLTTGAALSANFPPVFSNAAVDVKAGKDNNRHWVTDGGAAENRGTLSALYVLRKTLRQELKKPAGARRQPLPVHIVVAEASAMSLDFSQDRGVSSMMNSAAKFASQLSLELLDKIKIDYEALKGDKLSVHFLPMPLVLRSRGGVGTHWKLPAYVTLANPKGDKKPERETDKLIVSDKQARELIMNLYLPKGERGLDTATGTEKDLLDAAWQWIEGVGVKEERFQLHRKNWDKLCDDFAPLFSERGP